GRSPLPGRGRGCTPRRRAPVRPQRRNPSAPRHRRDDTAYARHGRSREQGEEGFLMYPPSVEYFAPTTLEEAGDLLVQYGDQAKVLAGGQSLIPLMKLRFAAPQVIVDINRIDGLDGLGERGGGLVIGALVRHKTAERSELLRGRFGMLGDTAPQISDPIV